MALNLRVLATGDALSKQSRDQFVTWLVGCQTGDAKLRAGVPATWRVGDKTGSGGHGTTNDVAVMWPPGRAPVMVCVYITETRALSEKANAILMLVANSGACSLPPL
jgi:beta-lactamase class A